MASNSAISLQHFRSLGIDRGGITGIYMLNENTLVYFAGNNIVLHNLESHEQRYLPYTDTEKAGAKCVAVTPNCTLLAYAQVIESSIIYLIDVQSWTRKKPICLPSGLSPTPFSALAFSHNGKYLIAMGASQESLLYYFDVQNGNLLGTNRVVNNTSGTNSTVTCISFSPTDPNFLCCTGRGIFRQYTRQDSKFIQKSGSMGSKDSIDFKSHIWLPDNRIIVSAADGHIYIVENSSVMINIALANTSGAPVTNLMTTPKGFVCVTGGNRLHIFERQSERGFAEVNAILVDEKETITSTSLIQGEDRIACLLSDARVISIPLSQTEGTGETIQSLLPQMHIGPIAGLDVAFRKQLFVSCGEDHSIRVWNYDKMTCEISKFFAEQPLSVSFHPNGTSIIAGFAEKLRFMAITIDDIVTHREFPIRGCKECKFSHGGQYFAAVNGNNVQVYSSATFKNLVNLRSPGQRVKSIAWSTDDNILVSCDANGTMTLHTVRTGKQKASSNQQQFHFNSIVCADAVGTRCYGLTLPDNMLRETEDLTTKNQLQIGSVPCQLVMGPNNKCLFVSTEDGTIRVYNFPGSSSTINFPTNEGMTEVVAHHRSVTAMCSSPDNQYLFTAGQDGCIYMMRIVGGETQVRQDQKIVFSEDVLISRAELVEQQAQLKKAHQAVQDLKKEQDYKLEALSNGFKQKLSELKQKIAEEKEAEAANLAELEKQIAAMNEDAKAQQQSIRMAHQQELQQKKATFEMRMQNERDQQEQLKVDIEREEKEWSERYEQLKAENEEKSRQIKEDYERQLQQLQAATQTVSEEEKDLEEEFNQWEVDQSRELSFEIGKREFEAQKVREKEKKLSADVAEKMKIAEAECTSEKQKAENSQKSLDEIKKANQQLKDQITKKKQEQEQLQRELEERKANINEKQIRIEELISQNTNLEKHKQLICDRINDWKKQIEPMEARKQDVSITHRRMKEELQRYEKSDEQLRLEISELKLKIDSKKSESEKRQKQLEDVKQLTRQFKLEVHTVFQQLQADEHKEEKARKGFEPALADLYRKYVGEESTSTASKAKVADIQVERNRERDALERNITAVSRRINRGDEEHERQHGRMMEESVMLMTEISEMRRQNHILQKRQRIMEESSKMAHSPEELTRILEMQKDRIAQLQGQIKQLQLRGNVSRRNPVAPQRLPPMNPIEPPK